MKLNITVLDGHPLNPGDLSWSELEKLGNLTVFDRTLSEEIWDRLDGDVLITNKTPLSREAIMKAKNLKYIGVLATGYNVVDVEAAKERNIPVCYAPDYCSSEVAQHIFALLLEICNKTSLHSCAVKDGNWYKCPEYTFHYEPLIELNKKTIGFLGMGKIGTKAAIIAQSFGMNVLAHHSSTILSGVQYVDIDTLLKESDVLSLNCPLNADTKEIINKENIDKMKDGAVLINTSRGGLINENDLVCALKSGKLYAAGLDVLAEEPPKEPNELISLPNVVVTPHIAWAGIEARKRLMTITVSNLKAFLNGTLQNNVK